MRSCSHWHRVQLPFVCTYAKLFMLSSDNAINIPCHKQMRVVAVANGCCMVVNAWMLCVSALWVIVDVCEKVSYLLPGSGRCVAQGDSVMVLCLGQCWVAAVWQSSLAQAVHLRNCRITCLQHSATLHVPVQL